VQAITSPAAGRQQLPAQSFPEDQQLAFGRSIIQDYGYDFNRGRQDMTHHPFMTKFSLGDVRITTRVKENDLGEALFSTLHEAGHAMYELGINLAWRHAAGRHFSAGVHESQSRLWENLVGAAARFWEHYYPKLQQTFPGSWAASRWIPSTAPSTRSSARSSAPTPTK
jgi:carboxypeptidase Taq